MLSLILFIAIIFIRYVVFSFSIESLVKLLNLEKIFNLKRKTNQKRKEIILSAYSSIIFGIFFYYMFFLWEQEKINILTEEKSAWYHFLSISAALMFHETYYYWLHRLMHYKKIYKYIHKGHHDSVEVSSWTAFAFDPLETFFQVLPLYIIIQFIPLHLYSVLFLLIVMSLSATINHLNREIYPMFFRKYFPFNLFIGATHHALHHKEFKTNYGLYFTFWDKIMKTESRNY